MNRRGRFSAPRPGGESRSGKKIRWPQGCVGSTPSSRITIFTVHTDPVAASETPPRISLSPTAAHFLRSAAAIFLAITKRNLNGDFTTNILQTLTRREGQCEILP
jgi:hypothetical protein